MTVTDETREREREREKKLCVRVYMRVRERAIHSELSLGAGERLDWSNYFAGNLSFASQPETGLVERVKLWGVGRTHLRFHIALVRILLREISRSDNRIFHGIDARIDNWRRGSKSKSRKKWRAAVSERLACSPPTKANRAQSPARSLPDFNTQESCRTMLLVGGFSRGSLVFPGLSFRRYCILTLIGSQGLLIYENLAFESAQFTVKSLYLAINPHSPRLSPFAPRRAEAKWARGAARQHHRFLPPGGERTRCSPCVRRTVASTAFSFCPPGALTTPGRFENFAHDVLSTRVRQSNEGSSLAHFTLGPLAPLASARRRNGVAVTRSLSGCAKLWNESLAYNWPLLVATGSILTGLPAFEHGAEKWCHFAGACIGRSLTVYSENGYCKLAPAVYSTVYLTDSAAWKTLKQYSWGNLRSLFRRRCTSSQVGVFILPSSISLTHRTRLKLFSTRAETVRATNPMTTLLLPTPYHITIASDESFNSPLRHFSQHYFIEIVREPTSINEGIIRWHVTIASLVTQASGHVTSKSPLTVFAKWNIRACAVFLAILYSRAAGWCRLTTESNVQLTDEAP
ncbi:hypothetical protein PR048_021147 [Dryococelus australis]|uniref:Uncharacterized protein n=1 Tax=Dryococelus australis TaxID=614101 RepID=A0ABQ9GXF8_9NEOP|nr:hypothetical protein PR048_021147 [Dryococelus australis]